MGLGFYLNLHVLNDLWMCVLCYYFCILYMWVWSLTPPEVKFVVVQFRGGAVEQSIINAFAIGRIVEPWTDRRRMARRR